MEKVELEDLVKFSKTIKVLYVDGDPHHRESAFGVFKIFFHDIDTAQNGEEGFQQFLDNKYNLIITDINIDSINGIELIKKIRDISKDITILIMSSEEDKKHFMDLIKLGVDGYLLKPVQVKQFVEVIQKVIEKFKNKQELFEYKNNLEDIIKQKTAELTKKNELLKKNELILHERINSEVQKNEEKNKQLFEQSKMASMGEMIGNIAHQWRQPLSCISVGVTGMQLQKELNILEDKTFYSVCKEVNENAQYLSSTIDDFKNYIEGNNKKVSFPLTQCIESLLNLMSSSYKNNNIEIDIDISDDITIYGCINELQQCLINLFNNSIDILSTLNGIRYIEISAIKKKDTTIVFFKDNGGGIDENIIHKVFEPYFTTKHKSQGTGLGLNMTYNIIQHSFKGTIDLKNSEFIHNDKRYKGAQFTLTLPSIK